MRKQTELHFALYPSSYLMLCAFFLLLPLPWVMAWMLASLFHECCHLLALKMMGQPVYSIILTLHGAKIHTAALSWGQEAVAAWAGPLGELLLAGFYRVYPELAVCSIFGALYNLLPLYPLDGGRAVQAVLSGLLPLQTAESIGNRRGWLVLLALAGGSVFLWTRYGFGPVPLLFVFFLGIKTGKVTYPCKHPRYLLQ